MKKNVHVVPDTKNNRWVVEEETEGRIKVVVYKEDARRIGRKWARENGSSLIIHNRDGRFGLR